MTDDINKVMGFTNLTRLMEENRLRQTFLDYHYLINKGNCRCPSCSQRRKEMLMINERMSYLLQYNKAE